MLRVSKLYVKSQKPKDENLHPTQALQLLSASLLWQASNVDETGQSMYRSSRSPSPGPHCYLWQSINIERPWFLWWWVTESTCLRRKKLIRKNIIVTDPFGISMGNLRRVIASQNVTTFFLPSLSHHRTRNTQREEKEKKGNENKRKGKEKWRNTLTSSHSSGSFGETRHAKHSSRACWVLGLLWERLNR